LPVQGHFYLHRNYYLLGAYYVNTFTACLYRHKRGGREGGRKGRKGREGEGGRGRR
jgi:hypothetical protein